MDWTRGQVIGHGSSATVFLATAASNSGDVFAVKSADLYRSESLQREQLVLSSLCLASPHIVRYKGYDVSRENSGFVYNLFMEYVPGGSLSDEIRRRGGRLDESLIGFYTRQLVEGLQFIHSKGLVHCDIKARNVLIGRDGVKIADFGCAKWASRTEAAPIGGTPLFMAPEVARGEEQGFPSDIWALGCTMIEMSTGGSPWAKVSDDDSDPVSTLYRIGYSDELPEIPCFLSQQAKDFLEKCLRRNPKERPTANQLLKHPFLEEFSCNSKQIQQVYSDSPTSILEQGIWNSVDETTQFEPPLQPETNNHVGTSLKSSESDERIRRLSTLTGKPKWIDDDDDENWMTIRRHEKRKKVVGVGGEAEMIGGSAKVSNNNDLGEEEIRSSGGKEWLEFINKNVSCRISRNNLEHHSCRNFIFAHLNNLSFHTHKPNFVS